MKNENDPHKLTEHANKKTKSSWRFEFTWEFFFSYSNSTMFFLHEFSLQAWSDGNWVLFMRWKILYTGKFSSRSQERFLREWKTRKKLNETLREASKKNWKLYNEMFVYLPKSKVKVFKSKENVFSIAYFRKKQNSQKWQDKVGENHLSCTHFEMESKKEDRKKKREGVKNKVREKQFVMSIFLLLTSQLEKSNVALFCYMIFIS